jgi:hypothetical protein
LKNKRFDKINGSKKISRFGNTKGFETIKGFEKIKWCKKDFGKIKGFQNMGLKK